MTNELFSDDFMAQVDPFQGRESIGWVVFWCSQGFEELAFLFEPGWLREGEL